MTIKEFGIKIKEEGVDYKTLNLSPSLLPKFAYQNQDILDVIREYRDRIYWGNFMLHEWLVKYGYIKEFREYYKDEVDYL